MNLLCKIFGHKKSEKVVGVGVSGKYDFFEQKYIETEIIYYTCKRCGKKCS